MKKIGIIVGSVRPGRVGKSIADYVLNKAPSNATVKYELIDLQEVNLPLLDEEIPAFQGKYQHQHTINWSNTIKGFDGFIIVTPEYNYGYPASLKNALDYLYHEWSNKAVAFVGYGYSAMGSRSVMQLRQVTGYLQLKPILKDVLISLVSNTKDGKFFADEKIDNQLSILFTEIEKLVV